MRKTLTEKQRKEMERLKYIASGGKEAIKLRMRRWRAGLKKKQIK